MTYRKRDAKPEDPTTWWATISRIDADGRRITITSSNYTMEGAVEDWIEANRQEGDVVHAAKRTPISRSESGVGYIDTPLYDQPDHMDRRRLDELVGEARGLVTAGTARTRAPRDLAPTTAVTEDEHERARVVREIEENARTAGIGATIRSDATVPMMTYEQVYDEQGNVRPEYAEAVREMLERLRAIGRR